MTESTFPLLADPPNYEACHWDLAAEPRLRAYWLGLFRKHFPSLADESVREATERGEAPEGARRRADAATERFLTYLDEITDQPQRYGRLDILAICHARERALREQGIADPYRLAKQQENESALQLLPALLEELDAMDAAGRELAVVEGMFAGNIFDLGAVQTDAMFKDGKVDFHHTRARLKPRPWAIDDLDLWLGRRRHRCAVVFVDNAGPDIVLGMIPFARHLLQQGTQIILTANSTPSLNDVTIDELTDLIERVSALDRRVDEAVRARSLRCLPSGNGAPLIDLTRLAAPLCREVTRARVDLVVLQGMGRALETNFHARFTCDCLKTCMIKDQGVAEGFGAQLFDLVFRYEPGPGC